MSYIGNSPVAGPANKIEQGDSSVEVIDTGTGRIEFTTDGTKVAEIDASGNMKFDSGYGSAETAYGCRAWVNFNGTGTVAIRDSGNVSSITDNGPGQYTVNFAAAMPDTNYATSISVGFSISGGDDWVFTHERMDFKATSSTRLHIANNTVSSNVDMFGVFVAIFR